MLEKYGKGTPNDWIERHVLTPRNWLGIMMMLGIDMWLFGWVVGPLVWGVQMLWIPFWAAGIINGVGHAVGYRNHDVKDESRNISPIAIWLGGEELHNNHHADPRSATFSHRWFEFDIGWMYIRLLSLFGLARVEYAPDYSCQHAHAGHPDDDLVPRYGKEKDDGSRGHPSPARLARAFSTRRAGTAGPTG